MIDYSELKKILNSSNMSCRYDDKGNTVVTDSETFRGMPISKLEDATALVSNGIYNSLSKAFDGKIATFDSVLEDSKGYVSSLIKKMVLKQTDGFANNSWNLSNYIDPTNSSYFYNNIYLSPQEASSLYSQKGIFEIVINKKAKNILLNSLVFDNIKFSVKQKVEIKEAFYKWNLRELISDLVLNSLVYGGSLCFPLLKKDTPVTTKLPLKTLCKLGILGKDCIDYFVNLDRWNTFIIPPANPTQKSFETPEKYTIPFLGADVHSSRCSRIVTAKQAGFWGQVLHQGWGISDFCGYLRSGLNYKIAVQSIPLMIQQMSILTRSISVDGSLATEGVNAISTILEAETEKIRKASVDNPISMDIIGELKSVNRDFSEMPALLRLLRQDFSADVGFPEPLLFSSEKSAFASGDDTEGYYRRQNETNQFLYKEVSKQIRNTIDMIIIDTLGASEEVLDSLKYNKFSFDLPLMENSLDKMKIGDFFAKTVFDLVASRFPMHIATKIANEMLPDDMKVTEENILILEEHQNNLQDIEEAKIMSQIKGRKEPYNQEKDILNKADEKLKQGINTKTRLGALKRDEKRLRIGGSNETE